MSGYGFDPDAQPSSIVDFGVTRSGVRQLRRRWVPVSTRASVLIVHGIAEHSGRYDHVGRQLADAGLLTVSFDQRGFGETEGRRAHVGSFAEYHDDVEDHMAELGRLGVPVVLLGHSMGGLVAAGYAVSGRPSPNLLVLSAPALSFIGPALLPHVARAAAAIAPRAAIRSPFGTDVLAADPRVAVAYESDPLVVRKTTLALAAAMADAAQAAANGLDSLALPTLVLHGEDDNLVPPAASERVGRLGPVERRTYPGLKHEILNEAAGPEIIAEIIAWIDRSL